MLDEVDIFTVNYMITLINHTRKATPLTKMKLKRLDGIMNETPLVYVNFRKRIDTFKKNNDNENFTSKWKNFTITTNPKYKINKSSIKELMELFLDSRFNRYIYTIEHISTNIHLHASCEFERQKWRETEFMQALTKVFKKKEGYDISLYDSQKKHHLRSKNNKQAMGFQGYILKKENDKEIIFSDTEFLCGLLLNLKYNNK